MSTSNGSNKRKAVRFAAESDGVDDAGHNNNNNNDNTSNNGGFVSGPKTKKKKTSNSVNTDELDDIDEWKAEIDGDDDDREYASVAVSTHELLEAKMERKRKAAGVNDETDDTHVDNRTSLAAEGIPIEPFNMEQEQTDGTGYFDGDTYVFRRQAGGRKDNEEPDAWLDDLEDEGESSSTVDIRHEQIKMQRLDQERVERNNILDEKMDNWTEEDLYTKILPNLNKNESVMEGITRYGNIFKDKNMSLENQQLAKDSFNDLTEAANALLLKGKINIYQMTGNDIQQRILNINNTKNNSNNQQQQQQNNNTVTTVMWEYQGSQDGQIHGPYTTNDMIAWTKAGYFIGTNAVNIRSITTTTTNNNNNKPSKTERSIKDDLLSDLMDDDDDDIGENRNNNNNGDNNNKVGSNDNNNKEHGEHVIRSDWMKSDQVDFEKFNQ